MISKIYLQCPFHMQNALISCYGIKMYIERFVGRVPDSYLNISSPFSDFSSNYFSLQNKRLSEVIEYASKNVPYYRDLLKGKDVSKINAENIHDFLPIIEKSEILKNPDRYVIDGPASDVNSLRKLNTSGSSGSPLTVFYNKEARRINYKYYNNLLKQMGCEYRSKSTTLAGRVLFSESSSRMDRYDYFNRTQYLSSYKISIETAPRYIQSLNRWRPLFIDSYPSALKSLIVLSKKLGLSVEFTPKFILTSSETLLSPDKNLIEDFFGCPVIDHYGCTEMAVSAFSDGQEYRIDPLYSVVEIDPVGDDHYSLIVTGLVNRCMPLIRYRIGDCVSGITFENPYKFKTIQGRVDDLIKTPEGRYIGRMDPVFKGIEGVFMAQIVQNKIDEVEVKVVLDDQRGKRFDEASLINNLLERTSRSMNFKVSYHQNLDVGSNGKFKSVVSKIN